jgi:L,D-transpeptidase ErfK/SrfK
MDNENINIMDKQDENLLVPEPILQNDLERKPFLKSSLGNLIKGILIIVSLLTIVVFLPGILQNILLPISAHRSGHLSEKEAAEMANSKAILESSIKKLDKQLEELIPNDCYMIINSTDNEFTLKKGNEIVRKGKCSTGSYLRLENDKHKWLFKTPKGQLTVKSKKTDPIWTKPDWAFIEEGLPVPSPNAPSRFEDGVLGDYALVLGDGYMIHGTLWQRYLGLSVTHGCVRLNDADLEVVYKSLNKGSKVYIY